MEDTWQRIWFDCIHTANVINQSIFFKTYLHNHLKSIKYVGYYCIITNINKNMYKNSAVQAEKDQNGGMWTSP